MTNRAKRHPVSVIIFLFCMACSSALLAQDQDDYARAERLFNEAKFDSAAQVYLGSLTSNHPKIRRLISRLAERYMKPKTLIA